ncbi:hypothetical protein [Spirosoma fluviale]|uniref:Heparinase II/III-like protein n=1 Tax=Spirosoma fluviale TaxID=1597977 RepID=A0A286F9P2_9BACT|nr:hypothetical protein [Spirosoma fluviale]SOD79951.1 hypothetical protein SAMN06269250_1159 [Spirosoma fluviale]
MKDITRQTFLHQLTGLSAAVAVYPLIAWKTDEQADDGFYQKVIQANTKEVDKLRQTFATDIADIRRRLGFDLANLSAAFCEPGSPYYRKAELIPVMEKIIRFLVTKQQADGTLDFGNLASPPDTAFILEPLCTTATILKTADLPSLTDVKTLLKQFILKAGEALRTGGVHTPNHRWVISAALAKINALFPNPGYVRRIDEWLSEGIFIDKEGHYLERSMIYSEVIDRCLITMAHLLKRPKLLEPVRRNLQMTYFYLEPNGDLVTNDSRRQDQFMTVNCLPYYHDYRFMAIQDANPEFAAIARYIETVKGFDERINNDLLAYFLETPLYKQPLPTPKAPPVNFEKFFRETNLVRIRRNDTTTTLFGGVDFPFIVASGRSTSPNFFAFRKGEAILNYMRLSTSFFSTGYFHSQGITYAQGEYVLHQKIDAPYYQPLPDKYKLASGNYAHTPSTDGRFWNKMDFGHRPQSNIKTIETRIGVREKDGANELRFSVKGAAGVQVTIELCFNVGGQVSGLKKIDGTADSYFLNGESGRYTFGKDTIQFGPGLFKHTKITGLEGEVYSSHFGSLKTDGIHVYLTAVTPFEHTFRIG